jgi:hypothetical protein
MMLTGLSGLSGLSGVAGSAAAPAASSALVSGAGTAEVNGTYTPRGTNAGKAYYNLAGEPDGTSASSIMWDGGQWVIFTSIGDGAYFSTEDVSNPWDVSTWRVGDGVEPTPTVTEV